MAWIGKQPLARIILFTCILVLLSSQAHQVSAEFKFLFTPQMFYAVPFGSNFKLNCTTNDGNATTQLYHRQSIGSAWNLLSPTPGKLIKSGHVYTVLGFGISNAGQYQCRATNGSGATIKWSDRLANLIPNPSLTPPLDIDPVHAVVLTMGQSYNVTCSSVSQSTLKWFKKHTDGSETAVPSNQIHTEKDLEINKLKVVLMFKNAQKNDAGIYICKMTYQGKGDFKYSTLEVYEHEFPKILSSSSSPLLSLHSNETTLHCYAYGHPRPDVYWYKDGKQIKIKECKPFQVAKVCNDKKYKITSKPITKHTKINGSLTILDTNFPDDQGKYTCKAVNTQGEVNRTIDVNVQIQPVIVQRKDPFFQVNNEPSEVECKIEKSNPAASFSWMYQPCVTSQVDCFPSQGEWRSLPSSHTVHPSPVKTTNHSRVKVPKEQEGAFYRCTATNKYGTDNLVLAFRRIDEGRKLVDINDPKKPPVLIAGERIRIGCVALSQGAMFDGGIEWYRDKTLISPQADPRVNVTNVRIDDTYTNVVMTIINTTTNDSGLYTCDAKFLKPQKIYNDTIRVVVQARVKPNITGLVSQEVREQFPGYVEFVCEATTANPKATINWNKKQGGEWRSLERQISKGLSSTTECKTRTTGFYVIRDDNSHLVICKPKHNEHTGWYQCTAENTEGRDEKEVRLYVLAAAEFKFIGDAEDRSFQVGYGEDLLINCSTNDPNTAVFLYRKLYYEPSGSVWRPLLPKANKIIKNGQVYIVKNFDSNDDGYYWCNATNTRGRTINFNNPSYTILVDNQRILNSIQLNPKSAMMLVGSSVYFTCSAAYESNLQWFKAFNVTSVAVLKDLVREEITTDLHKRSLHLIIKNATVKDSGLYRCLLTYKGKESQREARLTVLDYEAPVIKSYSGQSTGIVEVRNSKKTNINCTVQGYPLPTIQWYKNGHEIPASHCNDTEANPCKTGTKYLARLSRLPNSKTVTSNLTIIGSIFPDDHGSYICMANNTKGHATVKIFVNIPVPPKISSQRHQVITVVLGTSINVTCSATGNPLPDVVWTRTDDPNRKVLSSGKGKALLKVKDMQEKDLGNYTCNATNTIMSVTALLTIKESKEGKVITLVQKEMPRSIVIGIICGSVVFTFIVVIICFILYRRQQKQTKEYKLLYFMKMGNTNYVIDPDRSLLEQCNNLPYDLDWEFPEERLILGEPLGSGAFGQVLKAEAIGMPAFKPRDKTAEARRLRSKLRSSRRRCKDEQNSSVTAKQTVAVKTLLDEASESDYKDLASELKILIHLEEHKNIVNVLGACTRGRRLLMIIEYAPHGNLLSFLRARRDIYDANWVKTSNNPDQEFTLVDLGMTAYQISRGMEFLASKKCVHRDLAARNVLVGENYVMKISDFGLARDIYQDDLYVKTTSGLLPVKWMALESLFDRVYTEKSDVWSFGIVLWEIFTLGGCPYPSVPLEGLIDFLNNDNRMERPSHCPAEMYDIMKDCWRKIPDQRPTFAELTVGIKRVIEKNAPKGNQEACLEAVHEPMRASNEYLTSAESLPSTRKTSLGNQATKAPNTKSDDLSKNSTASVNGIITEPEVNGNTSFFQTGKKRVKKEKKPLLPQSSFSSSKPNYINQHESAV